MLLGKRHGWQMLAMVAVGLLLGLGANFLSKGPLPLLRPLPKPSSAAPDFNEVDADFVRQAHDAPGTLLLDARAAAAYVLGHVPGALSLPLGEFTELFPALEPRLRQARLLVVYCSDRNCSDSPELAGLLWASGLKNLLLYRGGMEDWSTKGHAIER
jgi:rhodanese-related sulfurtransferase